MLNQYKVRIKFKWISLINANLNTIWKSETNSFNLTHNIEKKENKKKIISSAIAVFTKVSHHLQDSRLVKSLKIYLTEQTFTWPTKN